VTRDCSANHLHRKGKTDLYRGGKSLSIGPGDSLLKEGEWELSDGIGGGRNLRVRGIRQTASEKEKPYMCCWGKKKKSLRMEEEKPPPLLLRKREKVTLEVQLFTENERSFISARRVPSHYEGRKEKEGRSQS